MSHRLFAGLPVPTRAAETLHEWAKGAFPAGKARLVRPEQMHATLLFYPNADVDLRGRLVQLAGDVEWEPLPVAVGTVETFGRSAIAANLRPGEASRERLIQRLCRPFSEPVEAYAADALLQMLLLLGEPEMERFRRMRRYGTGLRLHVTIARARHGWSPDAGASPPAIEFALDRLVLYESVLGPAGAEYTALAQSGGRSGSDPQRLL